jgi:outer membrane protein OmpA-like peptidoglycan-associated protein
MGLIFVGLLAQGSLIRAQDARGAHDNPLVQRFPGSTIVHYEKRDSATYAVPTGPLLKWDYSRAQADFGSKKLDIEGEITRITYVVRRGASAEQVFEGFKKQLEEHGFKPLYEAKGLELGRAQGNLYQNLAGQLLEYSPKEAHFLSAKFDGSPAAYVTLYVTAYEIGATSVHIRPGQIALQLDVVEMPPASDRLVVVSASDISKGLETSGRIAIYGILFDSKKADINPTSRPAPEEIAKFLRSSSTAKLDVVGHTDNVGGYDSNLDLSRARAAAVAAMLVKEYDINPQRLRASGVGFLAPIASNSTGAGRAQNRRVELLPQ